MGPENDCPEGLTPHNQEVTPESLQVSECICSKDALLHFKKIYFIYLFLAALGLHCFVRTFSSCGERGLLFIAVRGLLIAVASLVAEHGL